MTLTALQHDPVQGPAEIDVPAALQPQALRAFCEGRDQNGCQPNPSQVQIATVDEHRLPIAHGIDKGIGIVCGYREHPALRRAQPDLSDGSAFYRIDPRKSYPASAWLIVNTRREESAA